MAISDFSNDQVAKRLYQGYNISAPGADTNVLATNLTPSESVNALRVTVCLSTGSVFNLYTYDGTTAFVNGLNESNALNAGDVYSFAFPIPNENAAGTSIQFNFQVETDSVFRFLVVDEVIGPQL